MNAHVSEPEKGEGISPGQANGETVTAKSEASAKPKRNPKRLALLVSVPLVLLAAGGWFYLHGGRYVETDNAYIQQTKIALSADISGRITKVNVTENQSVHSGDALFMIDPTPYQIALDQAEASLASARLNVEQLRVSYTTAQATLASANALLAIQQTSYDRQATLVKQGVNSSATLDQPKLSLQQAETAVTSATQQIAAATAALAGNPNIQTDLHPTIQAALAQVSSAQRNLDKTQVVAPADGIIANVASLNAGQFVAAGTTIASLVEVGTTWIEANFKETQLTNVVVGQPAEIWIDTYPGVIFEGKVASIGAATGSEFSLIPAQNATGNWVKVVQRIPVRITMSSNANREAMRTGMSTTVSVDTGKTTLDKLMGR